jgi:hypothetical protein
MSPGDWLLQNLLLTSTAAKTEMHVGGEDDELVAAYRVTMLRVPAAVPSRRYHH